MMKALPGTPYINMMEMRDNGDLVLHDRFHHDLAIWLQKHADQYDRIASNIAHMIGDDMHPNARILWSAARHKASAIRKLIHEFITPIAQSAFADAELSLCRYLRDEPVDSIMPIMSNPNDSDPSPQ